MRTNKLIFISLFLIAGLSLSAVGIIISYWQQYAATSYKVEATSVQLNHLSNLLTNTHQLKFELNNLLKVGAFNYSNIERNQSNIKKYLFLMSNNLAFEKRTIKTKDHSHHNLKVQQLKNIIELNEQLILVIKKIESAHVHSQKIITENLVDFSKNNILNRIEEALQRKIILEKTEIVSLNKKDNKNSFYIIVLTIIIIIVLTAFVFGYYVVEANRRSANLEAFEKNKLQEIAGEETRKLKAVNEKLEQANSQQIALLSDISHNIRTPLTTIISEANISLRNKTSTDQERVDVINRIKLSADKISILIEDLLFVARADKDTIPFDFITSSIDGIILTVTESYKSIAAQKNIKIDIEWPNTPKDTRIDPTRMKQAMDILIDNAVKYSYSSSIISIKVTSDINYINIEITNVGKIISNHEIPFIFDRFYRGNNHNEERGSGLGLSIAKWIIQKHNGNINYQTDNISKNILLLSLPI